MTLSDIVISFRFSQLTNAHDGMVVKLLDNLTEDNAVHSWKKFSPMVITLSGISIDSNVEQP